MLILFAMTAGVLGAPVSNGPPPNGSPNGPPPPPPPNQPGPANGPGPASGPGPANQLGPPAPGPAPRQAPGPGPAAQQGYGPGGPYGGYYYGSDETNQVYDQMGNLMADDTSVMGTGSISQGSNGNDGNNQYDNSIYRVGNGETDVNAVAANQVASLKLDSMRNGIKQFGNGNNDANKVKNNVAITSGNSMVNFNVANMEAKTTNTNGNTTVTQTKNINNQSDVYTNT